MAKKNEPGPVGLIIIFAVTLGLLLGLSRCFSGDDSSGKPDCGSTDLECLASHYRVDARAECKFVIEDAARYDHEWTDWATFHRHTWVSGKTGRVIRFHGNELKLQNGFGAWSKHSYWCDYDIERDRLTNFNVSQ